MRQKALIYLLTGALACCITMGAARAHDSMDTDPGPEWLTDISQARQAAIASERFILLSFSGTDWCIPCMRLQRDLFSSPEFKQFTRSRLVLLKLDFPARKRNALSVEQTQHNEALAEQYNPKGVFPLVMVIDKDGNILGSMDHPLPSASDYLRSLSGILNLRP